MHRRYFIGGGLVTLVAAYLGQRFLLNDPLGEFIKDKFSEKPIYEGNIGVGVGKFFSMSDTGLTGIVEEGFDSSEILEKQIKVYGKERKDLFTQEMTRFVQVDRIKAKDGSEIYRRAQNKKPIDSDFPSRKLIDEDKYLSPAKNFTYTNKDAWEKIGTNKIKLTGAFSPDYHWIYVKDEKDGKTNKIKVENMSDWRKYQLQTKFEYEEQGLSEIYIYVTMKKTVDVKERTKTRELFSANVNYISPKKIRSQN